MPAQDIINTKRLEALERQDASDKADQKHIKRQERQSAAHLASSELWKCNLKPAKLKDYTEWLNKFLSEGGEITHVYDYPMSRQDFYVATSDIVLSPLKGSSSLNVIAPEGIKVDASDCGHINVYYIGEQNYSSGRFVPCFSDT